MTSPILYSKVWDNYAKFIASLTPKEALFQFIYLVIFMVVSWFIIKAICGRL